MKKLLVPNSGRIRGCGCWSTFPVLTPDHHAGVLFSRSDKNNEFATSLNGLACNVVIVGAVINVFTFLPAALVMPRLCFAEFNQPVSSNVIPHVYHLFNLWSSNEFRCCVA